MSIREDFPSSEMASSTGGESDGIVYRTAFTGATLERAYDLVIQFLKQEGYGDLPMPANAEELQLFKLASRNKQILLFEDNGYVHNPIKILFPNDGRKKNTLILEIYNENAPNHLLRFHGKLRDKH